VAVIGSVALRPEAFGVDWEHEVVSTRLGTVPVLTATIGGTRVVYLTRSGSRRGIPPHLVAYKANIIALKRLGIRRILATSVVGALDAGIAPGSLVVLDQFLDFTRTRLTTMFGSGGFANVDVTDPYCPVLRAALIAAAPSGHDLHATGCYVGVDGPRYETRAEVTMYRNLGGSVIGMTNLPEVVLARESGLCYASLAVVSNLAAGLAPGKVSRSDHFRLVSGMSAVLAEQITGAVRQLGDDDCECASAPADFVPTEPTTEPTTEPAELPHPDAEFSLVLVRPDVVARRMAGHVVSRLEEVAAVRGIKTVRLAEDTIAALYDRDGIANLLPGIVDAHAGLPVVVCAVAGPVGTCAKVEAVVDELRAVLGTDALHNGIHASADPRTAMREIDLLFSPAELAGGDDRWV
jgi:5'-methylthioadenosine phosphorylase